MQIAWNISCGFARWWIAEVGWRTIPRTSETRHSALRAHATRAASCQPLSNAGNARPPRSAAHRFRISPAGFKLTFDACPSASRHHIHLVIPNIINPLFDNLCRIVRRSGLKQLRLELIGLTVSQFRISLRSGASGRPPVKGDTANVQKF
jgi:hypothetical protein